MSNEEEFTGSEEENKKRKQLMNIDFMVEGVTLAGEHVDAKVMRAYATGATRDTKNGKALFGRFLSPLVIDAFSKYMNMNRVQSDGQLRDGDNWQKGIPMDDYFDSLWRHFMDFWKEFYGIKTEHGMQAAICGIMFNIMGYYHEYLKKHPAQDFDGEEPTPEMVERLKKHG